MSPSRVRIVARLKGGKAPNPFVTGSLVVHVVLIAAMILIPKLGRGKTFSDDALIVELAPAFPTRAAAAEPAPPEPVRKTKPEPVKLPVPEETVEVKTEDPPVNPEPLPAEPDAVEEEEPEPSPAPGEAGAGPSGEEVGGPDEGSSIASFAGGDLQFAWYRASVTAALDSNWQRPILSGLQEPAEVTVAFRIRRDGEVEALRIEGSSGVPTLDRSALRAVSDASPLPALPKNWSEPRLEAVFVFRLYPEGL